MKKRMVFLGICFICVSMLAFAAGGGQQSGSGAKPEISIPIFDRGTVVASEGNYEDNRWTRWVNENSPVNVKWVAVPRWETTTSYNAMFAAGTAPDLVVEYNKWFMDMYYAQGVIQEVGTLTDRYSVAYKAYLQKNPELLPYITADDGKIYGITSARTLDSIMNHGMNIRKDWLTKFNMAMPSTTDEILAFARRVRDEDPDGNGIKDTYAFSGEAAFFEVFRRLFGKPNWGGPIVNGKMVDWTTTQGYIDYLNFRATIHREEYVDPEYVVDTQFARARQLLANGKIGVYIIGWAIPTNQWRELKVNVPTAEYAFLPPWRTNQGVFSPHWEAPSNYMALLSYTSNKGRDVMAFCDWMIKDGFWPLTQGLEGRHYTLINGRPQVIDPELNRVERNYSGDYAFLRGDFGWTPEWLVPPDPRTAEPLDLALGLYRRDMLVEALKVNRSCAVPYDPTGEFIENFQVEIRSQVEAIETNIFMGRISVDEGLRQINAYKNSMGWARYQQEYDAWYQANKHLF